MLTKVINEDRHRMAPIIKPHNEKTMDKNSMTQLKNVKKRVIQHTHHWTWLSVLEKQSSTYRKYRRQRRTAELTSQMRRQQMWDKLRWYSPRIVFLFFNLKRKYDITKYTLLSLEKSKTILIRRQSVRSGIRFIDIATLT